MGRIKRDDDPISSGDEDLGLLAKKFVDIGDIPKDLDLSLPPTSGLDFLRRTRLESMQYPDICTADMNASQFAEKQTVKVDGGNGIEPVPKGFAPSVEWQNKQVEKFIQIRQKHIENKKSVQKSIRKSTLPNIANCKSWLSFCLGIKLNETSETTSSDSETSESEVDSGSSTENGHPPLLRYLIWLTQPKIEVLLTYHVKWLKKYGFSHNQGRWIYALMTIFEKPLTPEGCNVLRSLARECAYIRSKLTDSSSDTLVALNLIICLVAHCFDQKDMADSNSEETASVQEKETI